MEKDDAGYSRVFDVATLAIIGVITLFLILVLNSV